MGVSSMFAALGGLGRVAWRLVELGERFGCETEDGILVRTTPASVDCRVAPPIEWWLQKRPVGAGLLRVPSISRHVRGGRLRAVRTASAGAVRPASPAWRAEGECARWVPRRVWVMGHSRRMEAAVDG